MEYCQNRFSVTHAANQGFDLALAANEACFRSGTNDDIVTSVTGHVFVAETPEQFTYDDDPATPFCQCSWLRRTGSNMLTDGRFSYEWDGDPTTPRWLRGAGSRLISVETLPGLLAILSPDSCLLSPVCDANGNVSEVLDGGAGTPSSRILAHYEYSPFGETITATGPLAKENPYRFSTKYTDDETKLVYYGYRYFSPDLGRWVNRDPIGEEGGLNLYSAFKNAVTFKIDKFGLTSVSLKGIFETRNPSLLPNGAIGSCILAERQGLKRKWERCGSGEGLAQGRELIITDPGKYVYAIFIRPGYKDFIMRSGRTVREHEEEHYRHQKEWKEADFQVYQDYVGKCWCPISCYTAVADLILARVRFNRLRTEALDWLLDCEDYPLDSSEKQHACTAALNATTEMLRTMVEIIKKGIVVSRKCK